MVNNDLRKILKHVARTSLLNVVSGRIKRKTTNATDEQVSSNVTANKSPVLHYSVARGCSIFRVPFSSEVPDLWVSIFRKFWIYGYAFEKSSDLLVCL